MEQTSPSSSPSTDLFSAPNSITDPSANPQPTTNPQGLKINIPTPVISVLSAIIAGDMVATLPMTLEYAKIQMQVNPELAGKTYMQALKHSFSAENGKDAYKIIPPLMFFNIPKVTSRFLTFQGLLNVIPNLDFGFNVFLAGLGAGLVEGVLFSTPQRNLQSRILAGVFQPNPQYLSFSQGLQTIYKEEGLKNIYRRFSAIGLREGFYNGGLFFMFHHFHQIFKKSMGLEGVHPLDAIGENFAVNIAAGGLAGVLCGLVNAPFELAERNPFPNKSVGEYLSRKYQKEGLRGLYKGTGHRLFRHGFDAAIAFSVYDFVYCLFKEL